MTTHAPCRFADLLAATLMLLCRLPAASAADAATPPVAPISLTIEYPQRHAIFQRAGKTGEIIIEGVCAGAPGPIEARFNSGPWILLSLRPLWGL